MFLSAEAMRLLLVICLVSLALLAVFYLSRRRLSLLEYIGWGLLAVLLPLAGPFIVLLRQPGKKT
jgi:hypothetical protein